MSSWKVTLAGAVLAAAVLVGGIVATPKPGIAQDKLIFSIYIPPRASLRGGILEPWAKQVSDASGGKLSIDVPKASVGDVRAQFTNLLSDVVNISLIPVGFLPPPMQLVNIAETPFTAIRSEAAAVASWRVWEKHLRAAPAWKEFKLVSLVTLSDTTFQSTTDKPYLSVADLKGQKLNVAPGLQAVLFKRLGATPVPSGGPARREHLSGGITDGNIMTPSATAILDLNAFVKNAVKVRGLNKTVFSVVMKQSKFDGLDAGVKAVFERTSGAELTRKIGKAQDEEWETGLKQLAERNVKIIEAPDSLVAELKEKSAFITEQWLKSAAKLNIDGKAALEFYVRSAAEVDASLK